MNTKGILNLPFESLANTRYCEESTLNQNTLEQKFEETFGASKFGPPITIPEMVDTNLTQSQNSGPKYIETNEFVSGLNSMTVTNNYRENIPGMIRNFT